VTSILLATATAARSTQYQVVDLTDDSNPANGTCTLREAIRAAATNTQVDACAPGTASDDVELEVDGTYTWSLGTLTLAGAIGIHIHGEPTLGPGHHLVAVTGGGRFLRLTGGSQVTLENFAVTGGNASSALPPQGGCVSSENGDLALVDMLFTNCTARAGGALAFSASGRQLSIQGTRFVDNHAVESGGVQTSAGAAYVQLAGNSTVVVEDSEFSLNDSNGVNTTAFSGALAMDISDTSSVVVRRCVFDQNEVNAATGQSGYVGGLRVTDVLNPNTRVVLEDLLLTDNGVVGGNAFTGNTLALAVSTWGTSHLTMRRVRVIGSHGPSDQGVQAQVDAGGDAVLRIEDVLVARGETQGLSISTQSGTTSILADHLTVTGHSVYGLRMYNFGSGPVLVENSIAFGNGTNIDTGGTAVVVSPENSTSDPHFVDAGSDDYELQAGSPAVDAGNKSFPGVGPFDALHGPRVVGAQTDLGALERDGLFGDDFESGDTGAWSAEP
jgi:CSLREA domain-containing protein